MINRKRQAGRSRHIRRVLTTFPGVFSGIGGFTIHKGFVSAKVAGTTASLRNPALDRILDFAAEAGLVVLIHNDMDVPFAKEGSPPAYLAQMKELLQRHPKTTIIWAYTGMGRIVRPIRGHAATIEAILQDPAFSHVNFDISWDEVAKYLVATPESTRIAADLVNRYPDRFLFGTDEVAPSTQEQYLRVYYQYDPLWQLLRERNVRYLVVHPVARTPKAHAREIRDRHLLPNDDRSLCQFCDVFPQ